jgi:hypothetical protein
MYICKWGWGKSINQFDNLYFDWYSSILMACFYFQNFTEILLLCRRCCALFWKSIGHPCLVPEHIVISPSSCPSSSSCNTSEIEVDDKDMIKKLPDTFGNSSGTHRERARSGDESQFEPLPELFVPVTPQTFLTFFSV